MDFPENTTFIIPVGRRFTRRQSKREWLTPRPVSPLLNTIDMAEETGPFNPILGKRVIVIADTQNIDCGANDLGFKTSWALLGKRIDTLTKSASRHAIVAQYSGDKRRMNYFKKRAWKPRSIPIRTVRTKNGLKRKGNVDHFLAFSAGVLVSRSSANVVILISGDGDLVEEVAIGIRTLRKQRDIVTMSLAGSTSNRLNAEKNPLIKANIEIGKDCLHPLRF